MLLTFENIINTFFLACFAYVYSEVLTDPEMVLHKLYMYLQSKLPKYLFKPLIGCFKCVGGQISLWYYIIFCYDNIISLFIFISLTIIFTLLLERLCRN